MSQQYTVFGDREISSDIESTIGQEKSSSSWLDKRIRAKRSVFETGNPVTSRKKCIGSSIIITEQLNSHFYFPLNTAYITSGGLSVNYSQIQTL